MFRNLLYVELQQYWFIIISLLGALLVLLFFVQGGQTLLFRIGKNSTERIILVNSLRRKWPFSFATLVTFGGVFFASFPLFYATSFGGAYWLWMLILFAFVIQAVSYAFGRRARSISWKKVLEAFLFISGLAGIFLVGIALATFFSGSPFSLDGMNSVTWGNSGRGLEAVTSVFNLSLGLSFLFLARVLGLLYFLNMSDHEKILSRSTGNLLYNAIPFLFFFLIFFIWLMLREGYAVDPESGEVFMEPRKYLNNLLEMIPVLVMFLAGMAGLLGGIILSLLRSSSYGIWLAGPGTVLVVFSLFMLAGFNQTAFYPSSTDLQSSLTIRNASSSRYTLEFISYVSLCIPVVVIYGAIAWRALSKKIHMNDL